MSSATSNMLTIATVLVFFIIRRRRKVCSCFTTHEGRETNLTSEKLFTIPTI
jgi:hypothetical protein